jgi:hypothetical protein
MEIAVISLSIIILLLVIERYLYAKEMNRQQGDSIKAIMSRNINEYLAAKSVDKPSNHPQPEEDEVPLGELTDEEFDKTIKKSNK